MKITKTLFEGLLIIEPRIFHDDRGYFFEAFNENRHHEAGISADYVQDNQSYSIKNVIRGLHFQKAPYAQTKLVRILKGTVLDVVVDLRKNQPTFKKVFTVTLSSDNKMQLLVPKGFAHGFSVLSEEAEILYKCDEYYHPECDAGIRFDDPELKVDWKVPIAEAIVSDNDRRLPRMAESDISF